MDIPQCLREQVKEYEKAGFIVEQIEHRKGAHFKVWFKGMRTPQIITKSKSDHRAYKNNIAHYRRVMREEAEQ